MVHTGSVFVMCTHALSKSLTKGIGRATAKALVRCGAEVIAFSRTQSDLDSLQQEVKPAHFAVSALVAKHRYDDRESAWQSSCMRDNCQSFMQC